MGVNGKTPTQVFTNLFQQRAGGKYRLRLHMLSRDSHAEVLHYRTFETMEAEVKMFDEKAQALPFPFLCIGFSFISRPPQCRAIRK